jgi:hypothetical protein
VVLPPKKKGRKRKGEVDEETVEEKELRAEAGGLFRTST